ncbi:MAG: hypothetical protein HC871_01770 [Rhizobiales bacterium]|nr:hypothetical protein [Hyphomicrobiales bacterium]
MTAAEAGRLERRLTWERQARKQAEALLEQKNRELYQSNGELAGTVSALEASSSRLSAILDHSLAGTLVSDQQDRVIVINRAARSLFRRSDAASEAGKALAGVHRLEAERDLDFLMDEIPEAIGQAGEGLARVSTIVQAVKQIVHPGSREPQEFDVNRAVEGIIEVARGPRKYVVGLQPRLTDGLPGIAGHQGELNQIMLNLIVNTAEAIAESGKAGAGSILVRTSLDKGGIVIEVSDNGCGLPNAIRDRIFEPFVTIKEVG